VVATNFSGSFSCARAVSAHNRNAMKKTLVDIRNLAPRSNKKNEVILKKV
jgi:hypothetical protein